MSIFFPRAKYKIGVVLSGGGAKGAYQAGAFKTFFELNLTDKITVISGTSIGALNGVMLALCDGDEYGGAWNRVDYSDFIRRIDERGKASFKNILTELILSDKEEITPIQILQNTEMGLLSQEGVSEFINETVDLKKIYTCGKTVYACAYNIKEQKPVYFKLNDYPEDKIMKMLLASSAVPYIFPPVEIDGTLYADGGVNNPLYGGENGDLTPVKPLVDHYLDLIIVVHLDTEEKRKQQSPGQAPTIDLYPSEPLEKIKGTGAFDFTKSAVQERIELGYRDSMVALAPIVLGLYTGKPIKELVEDYNKRQIRKIS